MTDDQFKTLVRELRVGWLPSERAVVPCRARRREAWHPGTLPAPPGAKPRGPVVRANALPHPPDPAGALRALNLMICVAGVTTVLGVSHDSSLLLMILAVVLGIGAWGLNGATVRVLTGNAPTWMRLLWLPGLLFSVVVTFDTYLSPSGATMLKRVWPPELPAMSVLKFVVLSAFAVVTVGSTTAIILLERLRKAAA